MALTESEELELLELEEQEAGGQAQEPAAPSQPNPSFMENLGAAAKNVMTAPVKLAPNLTPEKLSSYLPVAGTVAGGAIGGPLGSAVGAGLGQIGSRIADIGYGRVDPSEAMNPTSEAIAPMAQTAVGAIPDVSGVVKAGSRTLSQAVGKGLAKAGQAFSGARADVLEQAAKQGYSTYSAPSMKRASEIFGDAVGPEGQAALKQSASQAFDPALGEARSIATDLGTRLESGQTISAIEALKAKQATDRVISATPFWDTNKRNALFDWRKKFDDVIATQNGPLKDASTTYRKAIVKDSLLKPLPVNKHGEYSRLAPMLASVAGGIGGVGNQDLQGGAMGTLGYLGATSPLAMGAVATTIGAINPQVRKAAMAAFVQKIASSGSPKKSIPTESSHQQIKSYQAQKAPGIRMTIGERTQ